MVTKKTKLGEPKLDDLSLDDFDLAMGPKNDQADKAAKQRKPITKVAIGFAEGVKTRATSEAFIKRTISDALPRGYGTAINVADSTRRGARELYNSAAQELRPVLPYLRKAAEKVTPRASKVLPKSVVKKLDNFAKGDRPRFTSPTQQDYDNQEIAGTIAEIFKTQMQYQAAVKADDDTQKQLVNDLSSKQQKSSIQQLMGIRSGVDRQVAYQDQVASKYHQKSLEIQFRQYFVMRDMFKLMSVDSERNKQYFESLVLNTGLPETQKIKNSERFTGGLKDMLYNRSQQAAVNYIQQFGQRLRKNLGNSLRSALGGVSDIASLAGDASDAASMGEDFGLSKEHLAGSFLGEQITNALGRRLGRWARRKTAKNDTIRKGGAKLSYYLDAIPERLGSFARSSKGEDGRLGWLVRMFKDALPRPGRDLSLESAPILTADHPANFSAFTQRSITEVIPGFLSRIYQELQSIRTGKKVKRVEYNMLRGEFTKTSDITSDVKRQLFGQQAMGASKYGMDQLMDSIDPENKLSPAARSALMRQLILDVGNNRGFDPKRLVSDNADTSQLGEEHKAEIRGLFNQRFLNPDGSINYETASEATSRQRALTSYINDPRMAMKALLETGHRESLEKLGLLSRTGLNTKMNPEAMLEYMLAGMYGGEAQPQGPQRPGGQPGPMGTMGPIPSRGPTPQAPYNPVPSQAFTHSAFSPDEKIGNKRQEEQLDGIRDAIMSQTQTRDKQHDEMMEGMGAIAGLIRGMGAAQMAGSGEEAGTRAKGGKTYGQFSRFGLFGRWGGKAVGAGLSGAGAFARGMAAYTGFVYKSMFKTAKLGFKMGSGVLGLGGRILGAVNNNLSDVYVAGSKEPALFANRIRNGEYIDKRSKKVIRYISDIKGEVIDQDGNVVLSREDYSKGIYTKGRRILKGVGDLLGKAASAYTSIVTSPFKVGYKVVKGLYDFSQRAQDVYVKGERKPRLLKILMENGEYFNRKSGDPIGKPRDIRGEVVDKQGNIIISVNDLKKGLVNVHGQPFKSITEKLAGVAGGILKYAGKAMGGYLNFLGTAVGTGFDVFSGLLKRVGGIFNPKLYMANSEKTLKVLDDIYTLLDQRLNRKMRKGSWQEQEADHKKKSAKDKEERNKPNFSKRTGWNDLKDWLSDKMHKRRHRDDDDDDDDDNSQGNGSDDILDEGERVLGKKGGMWRNGKALAKRLGRKLARSRLGRGVGGRLARYGEKLAGSRLGQMAERAAASRFGGGLLRAGGGLLRAGGGVLRAGVGLGRGALAMAGLGEGAGVLTTVGGGLASVASGVGTALAGTASAIGGLISAPVLLTVGAIAAVGTAAYFGYKYYKLKKDEPLRKMRMAQYGVDIGKDVWPMGKILDLEDEVKKHVKFSGKTGSIETKDLDISKLLNIMGIKKSWYNPLGWFHKQDEQDGKNALHFLNWFNNRFKPVYLNWRASLNGFDKAMDLSDIDSKLKPEQKLQMLEAANSIDSRIYSNMDSPFGEDPLTATADTVTAAYKEAKAKITAKSKDGKDKKDDSKVGKIAGATAATAATAAATKMGGSGSGGGGPETARQTAAAAALRSKRGLMGAAAGASVAATLKSSPLPKTVVLGRVLTASLSARYKTYGLIELTPDRVKTLYTLEQDVFDHVTFDADGTAVMKDSPDKYFMAYCGQFGVSASDPLAKERWTTWFTDRFIPVLLQFAAAVRKANKSIDPLDADDRLKPSELLEVTNSVVATTAPVNGSLMSVWTQTISPWDEHPLNSDSSSTKENINALKLAASRQKLQEEKAKESQLKKPVTPIRQNTVQKVAAMAPKAVDNVSDFIDKFNSPRGMRQLVENAKAVGQKAGLLAPTPGIPGVTTGVSQPGKGTAGDVNQVPMPKGDGSWNAVKDTILAAAKMVGVDPGLMATFAKIESGFETGAKAGSSSATGLYQFVSGTWDDMLAKYGAKYGISPNTSRQDPRANALMGAEYLKENYQGLQKRLGRAPSITELYMAHLMGLGGASKLIGANDDADATQVFSKESASNPHLFYQYQGKQKVRPLTIAEVKNNLAQLVSRKSMMNVTDLPDTDTRLASDRQSAPTTGGMTKTTANGPSGGLAPAMAAAVPKFGPIKLPGGDGGYAGMMEKSAENTIAPPSQSKSLASKSAPTTAFPSLASSTDMAYVSPKPVADAPDARARRIAAARMAEVSDRQGRKVNASTSRQMESVVGYLSQQVDLLKRIADSQERQVALLDGIHGNTAESLAKSGQPTPAPATPARTPQRSSRSMPDTPIDVRRPQYG